DYGAARADVELGDARGTAVQLHLDDLHQIGGFVGQLAEAVDHLGGEGINRRPVLEVAEPAIKTHAKIEVGNVMLWDEDRRVDADLRRELFGPRLSAGFQLDDRVLEHRLVELETDLLDMARLLIAEEVAGAADIEIVAGEL